MTQRGPGSHRGARVQHGDVDREVPILGSLEYEITRELARARRSGTWTAVLVVEPAHPCTLDSLVPQLLAAIRQEDVISRIGPRTIGLLLGSTSSYAARLVASRAQAAVRPLTLSIGIRTVQPWSERLPCPEEVVREATTALEEARSCGGNLIVCFEDVIKN